MSDETHRRRRYARFNLIPWWSQERLRKARIMVVGAGAIGNEALKNLALLGVGSILIIDFDIIEDSNLTRSVLFRAKDVKRLKAEVAAEGVREINPDVKAVATTANVVDGIGLGVFRRMDVVIGALDNREARLAVNRACWKTGTPWIDSGIQTIDGYVRTFLPGQPPCYECTLTEADYEIMRERRSCQLMKPDTAFEATPTTPTIASIIGGMAAQETVKLLHADHGMRVKPSEGFVYRGVNSAAETVRYTEKPDCPSHDTLPEIVPLRGTSETLRLIDVLKEAKRQLGRKALLEFDREIVHKVTCLECGFTQELFVPQNSLTPQNAVHCGQVMDIELIHSVTGNEPYAKKTLAEAGFPPLDILVARRGLEDFMAFEIAGDAPHVFDGMLAAEHNTAV